MYPCLIQTASILLEKPIEHLISKLNYTGLEYIKGVIRSHHIQEIIDLFLMHKYALVGIWPDIIGIIYGHEEPVEYIPKRDAVKRLRKYLKMYKGILIFDGTVRHACAWNRTQIIDPNKEIKELDISQVAEFYAMIPIKENES